MLHQTMSRASHPLPILLPAVRSVPKCKPSPFQALCSSSQALGHLQQNWSTGLGEKKVKLTMEVPQALGKPQIVIGQYQQVLAPQQAGMAHSITGMGAYLDGYSLGPQSCCWLASPLQETEIPETSGTGSAQAE